MSNDAVGIGAIEEIYILMYCYNVTDSFNLRIVIESPCNHTCGVTSLRNTGRCYPWSNPIPDLPTIFLTYMSR